MVLSTVNLGPQAGWNQYVTECSLFPLSNFCLMPPHPLWSPFAPGCQWQQTWPASHDGECSQGASLCTAGLCQGVSAARAHSTAVLTPCLGSPSMQVCPTRLYENLGFRLNTFLLFTFFLSLAGYIFKGHRGTEWNTSILLLPLWAGDV